MSRRPRVPLLVVALALLGLIGVLATLQYRWLGRISEAERDRLRVTLETGAAAFAQDFDGELTRGYLLFQTDPLDDPDADDQPTRFAARYDRWHATSKFPGLISHFYVFTPDPTPRLEEFDPATRTFHAAQWPSSMQDWRTRLMEGTTTPSTTLRERGTFFIRRIASPIWESVPAIIVPSPLLLTPDPTRDVRFGGPPRLSYTILQLDEEYIAREVLPTLAEQHFTRVNGADFQIAVVDRGAGGRVVYHSKESFRPSLDGRADATADLFSIRTQDFSRVASEVHRFTAYAATLRLHSDRITREQPARGATAKPPVSIVVERTMTSDQGRGEGRGDTSLSVPGPGRATATPPRWQLKLAHQAGSLEAAVSATRRRNLFVSTSVLGVLGASMGLLILATRRAQRLAQQQFEFVATVSHELRTPLAVIRSAADNLADGIVEDEAQVRKYGELVRGEGRRLTEMVEQILEFAGIESGERRLKACPVAVAPLVQSIVDTSAAVTRTAGIDVDISIPDDLPPVVGDEAALGRVFQNLLGNAIKYGAAGGWVGIDARRHGDDVLITVTDRGIGIQPADQSRIFEPFYRAAAVVEAQTQGAGLGLSLVYRILQAHGGAVTVRSDPGSGAAFTVRLPVAPSERAGKTTSSGLRRASAPPDGAGAEAARYS